MKLDLITNKQSINGEINPNDEFYTSWTCNLSVNEIS